MVNKFNDIYKKICEEYEKPMENMRKTAINKIFKAVLIFLITEGILIFISIKIYSIELMGVLIALGIIAIILYIMTFKNKRNYSKFFKDNVIGTFVKEYSEGLEYIPLQGIEPYIYRDGEFEHYDIYKSEDLIKGVLDNKYKVIMSEVHTEIESTDSEGDTTRRTVFHGLVAKVDLEKLINANIKIRKNGVKLFQNGTKVEMDSGEFEKEFNVYSTNKIIAMQILTADIMQMFLDFKVENGIRPELTIKENSFYIRFATGNLFEAQIFTNSLDYKTLKKYYDTINFTLDIVKRMIKNIEETEI